MFCSESSPVLYIAKFSVSNPLKAPKVVWHSDRMCLIQKNQAASSETSATRSEDMSPISTETTKQPPVLTTHCVGRTGGTSRSLRRRMTKESKDPKTSLPKPVKSEVTVPPVMPLVPKPTEIPGTSFPSGSQKNAFLTTDKAYLLLDYKKTIHEPDKDCDKIDVPLWSKNSFRNWSRLEKTENINEDVFMARHKKCEQREQYSKKWYNKRIREQTEKQKNAMAKQKNKSSRKNKSSENRKSQSFYPDLIKLEFLEVTEELPILAFGCPIPYFDPSEFSLPWQAEGVKEAPKAKRGRPSVT